MSEGVASFIPGGPSGLAPHVLESPSELPSAGPWAGPDASGPAQGWGLDHKAIWVTGQGRTFVHNWQEQIWRKSEGKGKQHQGLVCYRR